MYSPFLFSRVKEFVNKYGTGIAKSIKGTGLFFPAVVGQSALESGYGEKIPLNSNNFGGIKYNPNLIGVIGFVESDTTEYKNGKKVKVKQKFSKFKDVESGFLAHIQVLLGKRYEGARINAKTPQEQILMIAKSGYTTTPADKYLSQMNGIIEAVADLTKIGRIK
jgi:flagellum-specific peptidoglycan hydrolase FlgJ